MRLVSFYGFALWSHLATALQLSPDTVLPVKISSQGLTRLSLKGEGVKDLFLYPNTFIDAVFLHKSGDVFISPQSPQDKFSLTLMSSKGTKQDLEISFEDKPVQPITLESKTTLKKWTDQDLGNLLLSLHSNPGEEMEPALFEDVSLTLAPHVTFQTTGAYTHQGITILKGEVKNHRKEDFLLTPESFPFAKVVSFETKIVKPCHHATVTFIKKGVTNHV